MHTEINGPENQLQPELHDGPGLMERALNHGDEEAFNELYREYFPRIKAFAISKTGDSSIGEDIAQETITKLWKVYRNNYEEKGKGDTALLFFIARNLCNDHFKFESKAKQIDVDDEKVVRQIDHATAIEYSNDPADQVIADEMSKIAVHALVEPLSPERKHLVAAIIDGDFQSKTEYGETYGIPRGTVGSRLIRARADMRQILREIDIYDEVSVDELARV